MNDPRKHHRRSIRLQGYDYTRAGAYFITICTQGRECLFGEIVDGEMILNELGRIVQEEWKKTPAIRREMELDAFVVMPDHIHGIVIIRESPVGDDGAGDGMGNGMGNGVGNGMGIGMGNGVGNGVGAYCHTPLHTPPHTPTHTQPHTPPHTPPQTDHAPFRSPSKTIGAMVRGFKTASTRSINARRFSPGAPVWQRNYYEHIIRDDAEWNQIREYIEYNPARWKEDEVYPDGKT